MLLDNLAGDILRISVVAIITMEGKGHEISILPFASGKNYTEEAGEWIADVPDQTPLFYGPGLQVIYQTHHLATQCPLFTLIFVLSLLVHLQICPGPA